MSREFPCIYFDKDGKCRKFSNDVDLSYCVMGPCPEQKPSNADRIRAMSDEELAVFLDGFSSNCIDCRDAEGKNTNCPISCIEDGRYCRPADIIKWLRQPARREPNDKTGFDKYLQKAVCDNSNVWSYPAC